MATASQHPARKRRADSFFGIHYDFHAREDCTEVGQRVTRTMIERLVTLVRPDYLQCDCKGHPGISSYPTRVGTPAPGFVRDQLAIWREVTAAHGVALYVHYSGVWDAAAIAAHPDWARIDEHGASDPHNTSVFGPYVDELLIPQLIELAQDYAVDGAWIDGECWATAQDFGAEAQRRFQAATGLDRLPVKRSDPGFAVHAEICRQGFRDYLQHYVDAVHAVVPDFQICSNWAYSSYMPELPTAAVDFLSGDYPLNNSVLAARFEGRCLQHQGRPWDLMAWSFSGSWGNPANSTKTVVQLQQEAAMVLALGGGFQLYVKQNRDGSIREWVLPILAQVATFCRARQRWCHQARPVPQVAVLNSVADFYARNDRLFSPWSGHTNGMQGVLHALLDGQLACDLVTEQQAAERAGDWPVWVVPETAHLDTAFRDQILAAVRAGAGLVLLGPEAVELFATGCGLAFTDDAAQEDTRFLHHQDCLTGLTGRRRTVARRRGDQVIGQLYPKDEAYGPSQPAALVRRHGAGRVVVAPLSLGACYAAGRRHVLRDWLVSLVRAAGHQPLVEITGSHLVDVTVMRKQGDLLINLINMGGPHADDRAYVFDEIPPLGPLTITLTLPRRPQRIMLRPGRRSLPFRWRKGRAVVTLDRLEVHAIVQVEGLQS